MKIKFGSSVSTQSRHLFLVLIAFLLSQCCWYFQLRMNWSHDLILNSTVSNATSTKVNRQCGLPYANYSCSVLSATPNISQYCLNDTQIASVRLLPMLIFVLELFTIYDLFSVSEHCIRFILHVLGIISAFIFVIITILIYHNTCAQFYISLPLHTISLLVLMLTARDSQIHNQRRRASGNVQTNM